MRRTPPAWYLAVLAGTGLVRLAELGLSRRNLRQRGASPPVRDGFAAIVVLHLALFALPLAEIALLGRRPQPVPLGWAALAAGATALRAWSICSLGPAWSVRVAVSEGFQPSQRGPYRWLRHPNYAALVIEFLSLPMLGGAWLSAVLLSALHAGVIGGRIRAEEKLLLAQPGYRRIFAGRARLIPGVF